MSKSSQAKSYFEDRYKQGRPVVDFPFFNFQSIEKGDLLFLLSF